MTTIKTNIKFGETYRDKNSGFEGVAVCIVKWQYGCVRVSLQPEIGKDGKLPETQGFDEESLEGVKPVEQRPGGPSPAPSRNPDPVR